MIKEAFGRQAGIARRGKTLGEKAEECKCQHEVSEETEKALDPRAPGIATVPLIT